MLSQIRGRLLRSSFVESTLRFSTTASYSSNKKDGIDPQVIVGVSEPVKDESNTTSAKTTEQESAKLLDDILEASFSINASSERNSRKSDKLERQAKRIAERVSDEEAIQASFAQPRRVNFQRNAEKDGAGRKSLSHMKPGQLNIKMVDAAKKVAAQAGEGEKKVMNDLMDKLDEVFVGMERVRPGKKQSSFKTKSHSDANSLMDAPVRDVLDFSDKDFDALLEEGNRGETVTNLPRENQFVGAKIIKDFKSVDELLKLESPLNIFNKEQKAPAKPVSTTWQNLEAAEICRASRFEPLNWFDQCIVWTEEGKLWHFPINNEQGMDQEAEVDFTEHIFLDHHIEHWCPKEGPIKHFMELVTVGLSKNPYITVEKKKETLEWYENYFLQNQVLLEEIDAFGKKSEQ